jgi:glutathione S-transferase
MANLILHGPAFSTYVRTVRLALAEKGVDYDLQEIDFLSAPMPAEQLARHPFGKVPAMDHDGFGLYESLAISRYIDEAFDGPALQPGDVKGRARMTQIFQIIDNYAYPSMITKVLIQRVIMPKLGGDADEAVIAEGVGEAKTVLGELDKLLGGQTYFNGAAVSLADLHFVPVYDYFAMTPDGAPLLGAYQNLQRWWTTMNTHASVEATKPSLG